MGYDQLDHMRRLIEEFSHESTPGPSARPQRRDRPATSSVLLTGSTGNLGSDLLALLLHDPRVARIYALNRRSRQGPASERVHAQFVAKGLDVDALNSEKLVFIEGDTTQHDLGLGGSLYSEICTSISMIVHNAWPINLQQDLSFFEPNIQGLRNLINLGHASPSASALRFVFISSFYGSQSWSKRYDSRPVPEEVIMDTAVGCGLGYGASKHVAERMVARSGLDATSLRVVQLCGRRENGHWNTSEWIPIVMHASIILGTLPTISALIPFLPMDVTAKCIYEVISSAHPLPDVLHLSHPRPFRWNLLTDAVSDVISAQMGQYPAGRLPFAEWLSKVDQSEQLRQRKHPMIKLIPSVVTVGRENEDVLQKGTQDTEHIPRPRLSTSIAQDYSPTLRDLEQVSSAEAKRWVEYWMSQKVFQTATRVTDIGSKL